MSDSDSIQQQANAWHKVWAALKAGNPIFAERGNTGIESVLLEIERLRAELASAKANSERYLWLSEYTVATGLSMWMGHHQFLDAAIDEARKGGSKET